VDGGAICLLRARRSSPPNPTGWPRVRRYAERYRQPKERDDRVVIEISVEHIRAGIELRYGQTSTTPCTHCGGTPKIHGRAEPFE
jgi:hypothetical protein